MDQPSESLKSLQLQLLKMDADLATHKKIMSLVVTEVYQGADLDPLWTCTFAVVKDPVPSS
jgi:RNAse (barnase) inhibitor barstar